MPIDPKAVEGEILKGLPHERDRLDDALANFDFYACRFERYPVRSAPGDYEAARYARTSPLLRRVAHVLTEHLYREGPQRILPDHQEASDWLEGVYRRNAADSLWQAADRLAVVGDVAAFQVATTGDPECPVRIHLWDAHSFVVWLDPDDPLRPGAVATLDRYDERTRLRLYTEDEVVTYQTDKWWGQTSGGRVYKFVGREPNPYGIIPFSYVHFEEPVTYFWSGGPGSQLRQANDYLNFRLTELGDNLRYYGRPLGVAENVSATWKPPRPIAPGSFITMPAVVVDAAGNAVGHAHPAKLSYLQADLHVVDFEWKDLNNFIDHTLEMWSIPPSTVRMVQTSARSGVSIVAEQLPLILWAGGRHRPFARYEADLARLVLKVGGHEDAAGPAFNMAIKWPELVVEVPGVERDRADEFARSMGLMSQVMLVMKRLQMTRDEAIDHLKQIAQDDADYATIDPTQAAIPAPPQEQLRGAAIA